ncbi:hypothetical protein [Mesorhizobium sp.]|nr:hypothetical protein [Mesorhizobium sp.]
MIRTLMKALRRLFVADPAKEFLADWAAEIDAEETARKRRNSDA